MPIYVYQCPGCGKQVERIHKFGEVEDVWCSIQKPPMKMQLIVSPSNIRIGTVTANKSALKQLKKISGEDK
jgi:hypothetical protein